MVISAVPIGLATIGKLVAFLLAIGVAAIFVRMEPTRARVAMIFDAVATAAACYSLARAMAGIVTIQTAVLFLTLLLTLMPAEVSLRG